MHWWQILNFQAELYNAGMSRTATAQGMAMLVCAAPREQLCSGDLGIGTGTTTSRQDLGRSGRNIQWPDLHSLLKKAIWQVRKKLSKHLCEISLVCLHTPSNGCC